MVAVDQSEAWLRLIMVFGDSIGTELMGLDLHEQMKTNGDKVFDRVPVFAGWEETSYLGSNGVI